VRRRLSPAWLLLSLLCFTPALARDHNHIVGVPWVNQGRAPWCAAAAALSAANAQGAGLTLRTLVAQLQVHADGIAWFDLAEALRPQGFTTYIFHGGPSDIRRAVDHGVPPILSIARGAGRHALVITGYRGAALSALDPSAGPIAVSDAVLQAWSQAGGPMLVVVHRSAAAALALPKWVEETRDYRAQALARWAKTAPEPRGALTLLDRALQERPEWPELHYARAQALVQISRRVDACEALSTAERLLVRVPAGPVPVPLGQGRPGRVHMVDAVGRLALNLRCVRRP
jgi:hypothetical protein